jgi:CrcB protein
MQQLLIVSLGGFLGTMLRYSLNQLIYVTMNYPLYPYATLAVNVLGCFFIGMLSGLTEGRMAISPEVRMFVQVGLLGGFTTFSAFG